VSGTAPPGAPFRLDLEGLRGIAVLLIVLYHAGVPGMTGGYVGVDVFFVLSGFLITGLLTRELRADGRVSLGQFYARRARRILPASFLVLAVTLLASWLVMSPVRLWSVGQDTAAAALYVPNMRFAIQAADYWHPVWTSPVLHYWSLGVEEQFYFVWPSILAIAWIATRGRMGGLRTVIAVLTVLSFVACILLTPVNRTSAFYLLPTRAWELGVGALLAVGLGWQPTVRSRAVQAGGWVGLALIAAVAVLFNWRTPFPGFMAAIPVAGTALLVWAGGRGGDAGLPIALLSTRPLRFFGRISYSLYLWHWPILIIGATLATEAPGPLQVAAEVALAIGLSMVTYRWVEDPLRHGRLVGRVPRWNLSQALAVSLAIALVSLAVGWAAIRPFVPDAAAAGAAEVAPALPALAVDDAPLPADLVPSLLDPQAPVFAPEPPDGCGLNQQELVSPECVSGDPSSPDTVVLFGDSHAAQWYPAIERLAKANHWRLVSLIKASCPYQDVSISLADLPFPECDAWRTTSLERIAAERPALVIMAGDHVVTPVDAPSDPVATRALLASGAATTIEQVRATGADVVVIGDTPSMGFDPIECLGRNVDRPARCAVESGAMFDDGWLTAERAAAEAAGATFIDPRPLLCPTGTCPLSAGRYLLYRDTNHIAKPFSWALGTEDGALGAALVPALIPEVPNTSPTP
jgi:peptidoglycan/LPS O-acetylase OafA/YrhL